MAIRAKFKCTSILDSDTDGCKNIRMEAVIDGSAENAEFFRFTPSGQLTLGTINQSVHSQVQLGKEYYLDITPADVCDEIPY